MIINVCCEARIWRLRYAVALGVVTVLGAGERVRAQDWPQWRGPLGQGITSARNLPPTAGSTSLKMLWKTAIPGEGCSSPVVSQGRVYLTTAYEETQRHAWDRPAFWTTVVLACCAAGLALMQIPRVWRSFRPRPVFMAMLGIWTMAVVLLATVVLAKPPWFWQFADPWTGTEVVNAELPWVETLNLRPVILLLFESFVLIFIALASKSRGEAAAPATPGLLTRWLGFVALSFTVACVAVLALIGWHHHWFIQASQLWLTWPVVVLLCGSFLLIFIALAGKSRGEAAVPPATPGLLTRWLGFVALSVTVASTAFLGLIGWQPDWFFQASQPWLAWLVTGGLAFFALAGSIGWFDEAGKMRLLLAGAGCAVSRVAFQLHSQRPIRQSAQPGNPHRVSHPRPGAAALSPVGFHPGKKK